MWKDCVRPVLSANSTNKQVKNKTEQPSNRDLKKYLLFPYGVAGSLDIWTVWKPGFGVKMGKNDCRVSTIAHKSHSR